MCDFNRNIWISSEYKGPASTRSDPRGGLSLFHSITCLEIDKMFKYSNDDLIATVITAFGCDIMFVSLMYVNRVCAVYDV